ncbi:MAG: serine protease [Candidatus Gracilibacteria bacterium]|nr:serine protease [Candidatus Gracilibacteria bacterium]MDD2909158.1 serine protease [Candidatus Gracilibacteria bacterium]
MKKLFKVNILLVIVLYFTSYFIVNADELPITKVYNLEAYGYNKLDKIFEIQQYGSAVLIGKNQVITNAHVVLDEEGNPLGNYNLCITDDFENTPKCMYSMKLVKYDSDIDLALLVPSDVGVDLGAPIKVSAKKPNIGDPVKVIGYPSNGGSTITLTEGKISGKDNLYYKIDANIDSGNSGGGAFDIDNKLIGIPTIASVGLSTLGYMIPTDSIYSFLSDKNTSSYNKIDDAFIKETAKANNFLNKQIFISDYFSLDNPSKYGFKIDSFQNSFDNKIGIVDLSSKNEKVGITLNSYTDNLLKISGNTNWDKTIEEDLQKYYNKVIIKRNLKLGGKTINKLVILKGSIDDNNPDYLEFYGFINNVSFSIYTDNFAKNKNDFINGFKFLILNVKIKDKQIITSKEEDFGFFKFDLNNNFSYQTNFDNYYKIVKSLTFNLPDDYNDGTIYISEIGTGELDEMKKLNFEEYIESNDDYTFYGMKDQIEENVIKKTSNNFIYRYVVVKTKPEDETNFQKSYFVDFVYDNDGIYYVASLRFWTVKDSDEFKKSLNDLIENIKVNGKIPFKGFTLGDIILKKDIEE